MDTASEEAGVPWKVYIKMLATCLDDTWMNRLVKLDKYFNETNLWMELDRILLESFPLHIRIS